MFGKPYQDTKRITTPPVSAVGKDLPCGRGLG